MKTFSFNDRCCRAGWGYRASYPTPGSGISAVSTPLDDIGDKSDRSHERNLGTLGQVAEAANGSHYGEISASEGSGQHLIFLVYPTMEPLCGSSQAWSFGSCLRMAWPAAAIIQNGSSCDTSTARTLAIVRKETCYNAITTPDTASASHPTLYRPSILGGHEPE